MVNYFATKKPRIYNREQIVSASPFNKSSWGNWMIKYRMKQPYLIPHRKINSKQTKDLNVKPETIKLLEENMDSMLFDIGPVDNFRSHTKIKNKQAGLHQTKELLHSEGNQQQQQQKKWAHNKKPTKWAKIFENASDQGLNKIHKELIQLNKQPN